jgi:hypothetical protein
VPRLRIWFRKGVLEKLEGLMGGPYSITILPIFLNSHVDIIKTCVHSRYKIIIDIF